MCIIRCKIGEENAKLWYSHACYLQVTLRVALPWTGRCQVCRSPLLPASHLWHTVSIFLPYHLKKMMKISCWPPESARNEVILVIIWPQKQSTLQSNWWGLILTSFEVALYSLNIFIGSTKVISPTKNKWFFEEKISMGSSYKYIVQYANMMVEQGNCLYITLKIEEERYVSFPSVAL